jgi:hypothetical protein
MHSGIEEFPSMKTRITFGTMAALAWSGAIALGLPQSPAPTAPAKLDEKPATVVGCVQAGTSPGQFVLTAGTAQDARPTAPGATDKAVRYTLLSQGEVNLQKLVGKKVEVTGTVSSTPTLTRSPDPTPGASARAGNDTMIWRIVAKSVKDVAPTC